VRFARDQLRQNLRDVVDGADNQRHAELLGEPSHQIELRPGRTVGANEVRSRAVARDYAQLTNFDYLIEQGRR
jgi:hypothetical protein